MITNVAFRRKVWAYYRRHGRHDLLWRQTTDPYHVLVSEVMLQQTQVERVLPKYQVFLKKYPTYKHLARAPLADVLTLWVGLGYNRRAKFLKAAAEAAVALGAFPKTESELRALPGVGPYTAAAVAAFAYNQPVVMIETNIRTVYIHHFFPDTQETVPDTLILEKVAETFPKGRSRQWYAALMDYGVYLKKTYGSNNHRSKSYIKQKAFKGSDRQIRGLIIKTLTGTGAVSLAGLAAKYPEVEKGRIDEQLQKLEGEGLIEKVNRKYQIAT